MDGCVWPVATPSWKEVAFYLLKLFDAFDAFIRFCSFHAFDVIGAFLHVMQIANCLKNCI